MDSASQVIAASFLADCILSQACDGSLFKSGWRVVLCSRFGEIGEPAETAVPELVQAVHDNADNCEGYSSSFCESFIPALGKIGPSAKAAILTHHGFGRFMNSVNRRSLYDLLILIQSMSCCRRSF